MNLVMFGSPNAHRKVLHWILVDKKIIQLGQYRNFTDRLNSEWNGYAIFVNYTLLYIVDVTDVYASLLCCLLFHQLSRGPICPDSNVCNPCVIPVHFVRHGLICGHTSLC
jgi:hypothetical protein